MLAYLDILFSFIGEILLLLKYVLLVARFLKKSYSLIEWPEKSLTFPFKTVKSCYTCLSYSISV